MTTWITYLQLTVLFPEPDDLRLLDPDLPLDDHPCLLHGLVAQRKRLIPRIASHPILMEDAFRSHRTCIYTRKQLLQVDPLMLMWVDGKFGADFQFKAGDASTSSSCFLTTKPSGRVLSCIRDI